MDRKLGIYQVSDIRLDVNICECNVSIYIYISHRMLSNYSTYLLHSLHYAVFNDTKNEINFHIYYLF